MAESVPTPRSGVRAVAQGASPGSDFIVQRSRKAAAELQPSAPLGLRHRRTPNPSACALGYFLTPLRGLGIAIAVSLLFGRTAKKAAEQPEGEHVVTVDVAPVLSTSISLKVTSDALLYPLQQAAIVPKISAPVKKFYADRGVRVRAGQLLAELENRDLSATAAVKIGRAHV